MNLIQKIKNIFKRRIDFDLYLTRGERITHLRDEKYNTVPIYTNNKTFIKHFLKLSTKRNGYKIRVSNKEFKGGKYTLSFVEKQYGFISEINYELGNYSVTFCSNNFLYYFKNEIPNKIYFSVEKTQN
jgi:hypothetical protein